MLLEGTLVGAALCGVLSVDEGVVFLAVLVGMGEGYLDILALHVDDGIDALIGHRVVEQVFQSVAAQDAAAVVHDDEPRVEIGVVAEHDLHNLVVERIVLEERVVGLEGDEGARLLLGRHGLVAQQVAALEDCGAHLSLAVGAHLEMQAQRIDRLYAHAVESHTLLEGFRVVFTTCVEHADRLDELALRYAPPVVSHGDALVVLHIYFDAFAGVHLELIDRVVYHLLEEHIDAVFGQGAVAQASDIHAGARAHVLHVGEVDDIVVGIVDRFLRLLYVE